MGKDLWLRIIVLTLGIALFVLLWVADKTNLNSQVAEDMQAPPAAAMQDANSQLPPLSPDPTLDRQIGSWESAPEEAKGLILDSIITTLSSRQRYALAANYAMQRIEVDGSNTARLEAGILSQQAMELSYVGEDSVLLGRYRDQAIRLLTPITAVDTTNEEALLALGLALTRSAQPMQGILTVRKVVEINPDNVEANLRLGEFSLQTGQFDKARQRFEKILSLQPENQDARLRLAVSLAQTGELDAAKAALQQVIAEADDLSLKQDAKSILDQLN